MHFDKVLEYECIGIMTTINLEFLPIQIYRIPWSGLLDKFTSEVTNMAISKQFTIF